MQSGIVSILFLAVLAIGCTQPNGQNANLGNPFDDLNAPPIYIDPIMYDPARDPMLNAPNPNLGGLASCDTIMSAMDREACYTQYAIENQQEKWCADLWQMTNDCYSSVAYTKKDAAICEKVKNSQDASDMCYFSVAGQTKDLALCAKISPGSIKTQCESDNTPQAPLPDEPEPEAPLTGEANCENQPNENLERDACYLALAIQNPQLAICEKMIDQGFIDGCYIAVAIKFKDETICSKVSMRDNGYHKTACYFDVAGLKMDPSICALAPTTIEAIETCQILYSGTGN